LEVNMDRRLCHDPENLALFMERFSLAKLAPPKLYPETLFVYGERDLKYKTLYRTLRGHVNVEGAISAGHAVHLENPRRCAELIGITYDHHSIPRDERYQLARDSQI
ncbi:MAG: hypothetical protein K940chlam2_01215, partial [Chlamydiae bacterium]|nr:hypothetical protein [Chlamydiota bacterium]